MARPDEAAATGVADVELARVARMACLGVAGVAGMSRGRLAVARTFGLGGDAVEGVQLARSPAGLAVEVHLIVRPVPIPPVAAAVQRAVASAIEGAGARVAEVDVWVDALQENGEKEDG